MKQPKSIGHQAAVYLAGFFDGEGCIGVYKNGHAQGSINPIYNLRLSISNTHHGVLHAIKEACGGSVSKPTKADARRKPLCTWSVSSRSAGHVLKSIAPFLIVKKEQATLGLEFNRLCEIKRTGPRKSNRQGALTPSEITARETIRLKLMALKKTPNFS